MKFNYLSILLFLCSISISAQSVEIVGSAKVTEMSEDNTVDELVIRKPDGTLGTRAASSLPPNNPIDTSKNLASDFELAKHLCECGTNLPPFMINSLLASGYTEDDLLGAGVPFDKIFDAKPIEDGDGNIYTAVTIGGQTILRENLRTTKYNDGTSIPLVTSSSIWSTTSVNEDPAYCYVNGSSTNTEDFGLLYNGYAITADNNGNKEVCPSGWHIPTTSEWITLRNFLGTQQEAGIQMKEGETDYWINIGNATNSSGFNGRGGGRRNSTGSYSFYTSTGYWWDSSAAISAANAKRVYLNGNLSILYIDGGSTSKETGYTVRCMQD